MANSAGQSSPSNPAHLVGRVGRARKKPGPVQLEPPPAPSSPLDPRTARTASRTVKTGNRPVWAKIFKPADQPTQPMNFTVRSWAVKSQPSPLRPTDENTGHEGIECPLHVVHSSSTPRSTIYSFRRVIEFKISTQSSKRGKKHRRRADERFPGLPTQKWGRSLL
uniref:Cell wall beta-fructosidase-like protein n=1 Tax=Beta vulgaris TaxID=161934 RepID=I6U5E7_BETVU|nr:cell wall beta-fructosidase-like protein [Beta vulgaris]